MPAFSPTMTIEYRKLFRKKCVLFVLAVLIFNLYFLSMRTKQYKLLAESVNDFYKVEESPVTYSYQAYARVGIRIMTVPSLISILFKPITPSATMESRAETTLKLDITKNLKGAAIFEEDNLASLYPEIFANIIYFLGSLFALGLGAAALRGRKIGKFCNSHTSQLSIFFNIVFARISFLFLVLFSYFVSILLFFRINGINISGSELFTILAFFIQALLFLIFFFSIGLALSNIKKLPVFLIVTALAWVGLIAIIPSITNMYIRNKASSITSNYKIIADQEQILRDFESEAKKKYGEVDISKKEKYRGVTKYYLKSIEPEVNKFEIDLISEIKSIIEKLSSISTFIPTSHYKYCCQDFSSIGYNHFLNLFDYTLETKKKFLRFWIDRVYYHDDERVVPFIKGKENIYYAEPVVPSNYWPGNLLTILYCLILAAIAYRYFVANLNPKINNKKDFTETKMNLNKHFHARIETIDDKIKNKIINLFTGKTTQFTGEITVDDENIIDIKNKKTLYIPSPNHFPPKIKTRHLLEFLHRFFDFTDEQMQELNREFGEEKLNTRFGKLDILDRALFILKVVSLTDFDFYLFDEFAEDIPNRHIADLREYMKIFKDKKAVVIAFINIGNEWLHATDIYTIWRKENQPYQVFYNAALEQ